MNTINSRQRKDEPEKWRKQLITCFSTECSQRKDEPGTLHPLGQIGRSPMSPAIEDDRGREVDRR
jgi:hypothetical protein